MADKKLIDKVKALLDSNANASLKEAAKKWLDEADAKYGDKLDGLKEKGSEAWDKIGDFADKYSEKAIEANEKLGKVSDKIAEGAEKFAEKAGPKIDELKEKAAPKIDELKEKAAPKIDELKGKAAPVVDKVTENEFIKALKDGVASLDEVIDIFSKPDMKEKMGEEAAEQIRSHAEAMKAEGKKFCDCPACTQAREILRDLGVDIEEPEVEEPAADEPEAE